MTSIEKSKTIMTKSALDYIAEVTVLIGRDFPITIKADGLGNMVYCKYETSWKSGTVSGTQKNESLTAQEQTIINTWRDSYIGV